MSDETCPNCGASAGDINFDRSLCPCSDAMHYYCNHCGYAYDCLFNDEEQPAQSGGSMKHVEPRNTHWARKRVSYDDRFLFLMEAVGELAKILNESLDPNSPWEHELVQDRVREVERHAREWVADIDTIINGHN